MTETKLHTWCAKPCLLCRWVNRGQLNCSEFSGKSKFKDRHKHTYYKDFNVAISYDLCLRVIHLIRGCSICS